MGNSLEKPKTAKESVCGAAAGELQLSWASSCMQGWRLGMEDAHITINSFNEGQGQSADAWQGLGLFGVFDGHGGEQVARFCHRHLPEELSKFPLRRAKGGHREDLEAAFVGAFHRMDDMLRDRAYTKELQKLTNPPKENTRPSSQPSRVNPHEVGCTACVCCITDTQIVTANAGDSRAVLCCGGNAVPLSFDHKPNDAGEQRRIEKAGGKVHACGQNQYRVNGNLNLSRAIGDLNFKQGTHLKPEEQMICATPDVLFRERSAEDEFIVVCCDGVWDMMSCEEVVDFVRQRLPKGREVFPKDMERIMEALLDRCLSPDLRTTEGLGGDNMTAVMVRFEKEVLPRIASVSEGPSTTTGGTTVVTFDLPQGCTLDDLVVHASESSAAVHLGVKHRTVQLGGRGCSTALVDLAAHLPAGATFHEIGGISAKFYRKMLQMAISVSWQRSS